LNRSSVERIKESCNGGRHTQRAAFKFFREHLQSQETFTIKEFIDTTGWEKLGTLNTYLRKHYKGLIENANGDPLQVPSKGMPENIALRITDAFGNSQLGGASRLT
jgi:hypothetical protein